MCVCVLYRGPKGKARAQGCVRARKRALHGDRRSLSVCRYVLASQCTLSLALSVYVGECVWLFALTNLPLGRRAPARGTRLRSRSSHRGRVRRVGRCTHAGARVHWPRVSRGGRLVTEVRRQGQLSSPQPDESGRAVGGQSPWLQSRFRADAAPLSTRAIPTARPLA